jgi:hypothetical protein
MEKKRKRKGLRKAVEAYSEQDWMARQDAESLARAEAVKADPERMKRAKEWAARELDRNKAAQAEAAKLVELGTS